MSDDLPTFTYHPDPVASGVAVAETFLCGCCGQQRTLRYDGPIYGRNTSPIEKCLCFRCISDGSAAERFDVEFADAMPLARAKVPRPIVDEVTKRTPGYLSWQQDNWLSHCGDACEFRGDAAAEDVANASEETIRAWQVEYNLGADEWGDFSAGYQRGGGASVFYKFVCRHCGAVRLGFDLD